MKRIIAATVATFCLVLTASAPTNALPTKAAQPAYISRTCSPDPYGYARLTVTNYPFAPGSKNQVYHWAIRGSATPIQYNVIGAYFDNVWQGTREGYVVRPANTAHFLSGAWSLPYGRPTPQACGFWE